MDCRFLLHGIAVRIGTESQGDCTIGNDIYNVWYVLYYKKDLKKKKTLKRRVLIAGKCLIRISPPPPIFFKFKLHNLIPNILIPHC